ncbi:hypothetical protein IAT38_002968 [Cryptococcus sp. DSM 104549]
MLPRPPTPTGSNTLTPAPAYGHPPPVLLTSTLLPISLYLIAHPLLPLVLPHVSPFLPAHLSKALDSSLPAQGKLPALQANLGFALLAFVGAVWIVPRVSGAFVDKGLRGRDLLRAGGRDSGPWVPESMGLPCASLYIALMMLFIPFPFSHLFQGGALATFPQSELTLYLSSLLSLLTATLLGFLDDLFDIRWRHKLPIPIVAAVPTLLVYYSVGGVTSVVLPKGIVGWVRAGLETWGLERWGGWLEGNVVNLGPIYYIYLILLPTFTTNSINILAGINGVEVTQAFLIALSVLLNDLIFLPIWPAGLLAWLGVGNQEEGRLLEWAAGEVVDRHLMSAYFMAPLAGVCAGFLWHNWYPAKAFPGDTFCYFSGMAFSAVAIQGHFSKTLILFFLPQIFNFLLSCPQLFGLVECPRHRLPAFNKDTGLLSPSKVVFTSPPPAKTRITLEILELLHLVKLERSAPPTAQSTTSKRYITSSSNLTIINFLLVLFGPMHERTLCILVGAVQVLGSAVAFGIRYGVGSWVYGGERR